MKELLISQDMWEIVEKSFEMTNYWIILTSTKSAQFDGLKIRDSFFSSLNIREVDENTSTLSEVQQQNVLGIFCSRHIMRER